MAPYIFMEKNGIHIIDLNKTISSLEEASQAMRAIVRSGRKIMFVATKKQAQEVVTAEADKLKMPYVTDRWLGGMLTNFATVRKSIKKMSSIDKMLLGGITDLTRLPAALFVIDVKREHIAVSEAKKLGIPVFAMCDTNSNPELVDYPIPANDDAYKSIAIIVKAISKAIEEGLSERKQDKDDARIAEEEEAKRAVDAADAQEAAKVAAKYEKEAEQE
jgi:small subunit ribosomal protein S2